MPTKRFFIILAVLLETVSASSAPSAFVGTNVKRGHIESANGRTWKQPEIQPTQHEFARQPETKLNAILDIVGTSPEPIHTAFSIATFGPQPFWLLLILLPKAEITKKLMGSLGTF